MATRASTQPRRSAASSVGHVRLAPWRVRVALLVALLLIGALVLRLFDLQVVRHEELLGKARAEIDQEIPLMPQRGQITDRAGNVLAMDVDLESLWVLPGQIDPDEAPKLALTLSAIVQVPSEKILSAMLDQERYQVRIARWLDPKVASQVEALEQPGLRLEYEPRRVYPQNSFAAHVIGAVNHLGDGISGVEAYFDTPLRGITGTLQAEFDGSRNPIAIAPQNRLPPRDGANIMLTIDPLVQHVVETELRAAVEAHNADGGSIIVLDPRTGAIRGMASWPQFDPNRYGNYPPEVYGRNPAISNLYEPGSTMKIFTVAAGLQSRAFTADTLVNDGGAIVRYGQTLRNWNGGGNGAIDPAKVLYYSSNVGALQLNELTGPEHFYETMAAFGFGKPTGIEMGGEEGGIVNWYGTASYNDLNFLTNAYGQGISVTPLQMVQAVGAIANDGVMMKPYIVEQQCDSKGENCVTTTPVEVGRPVEPGVAWTIRRMLVNSANHYAPVVWAATTGSYADQWLVPGYQVGAKTGTSSIPLPGGGYDPSYTIGSVLGFAPAEQARFAVLVKIDRPKDDIWGVSTAIPVYYNVVDQLLRYERIPPDGGLVSPGQP
jgi:cell division protein FtsI/penicillin-binding protein 2